MQGFVALLLLLAGCAHVRPPEEGGPEWIELESEHFSLRTDLTRQEAAEQLLSAEQLFATELRLAWRASLVDVDPSLRLSLVIFRTSRELRAFSRDSRVRANGVTMVTISSVDSFGATTLTGDPMLVTHGQWALTEHDALRSVLAFWVADPFPQWLPKWLRIGMQKVAGAGKAGSDSFTMGYLTATPRAIPSASLLRSSAASAAESPFTCYLLVTLLRSTRAEGFFDFVQRLRAGESESAAFSAAFPDLSPEELDRELERLRASPQELLMKEKLAALPASPPHESVLSPAEVHATWALVANGNSGHSDLVLPELSKALALDGENVTARLGMLLAQKGPGRKAGFLEIQERHPDDLRLARLLLLEPGMTDEGRLAQADRLLAVQPDEPTERMRVLSLVKLKRAEEAVTAAQKLSDQGSFAPIHLVLLALAQAAAQDCPRAMESVQKALDLYASRGEEPGKESAQMIVNLRAGCVNHLKSAPGN